MKLSTKLKLSFGIMIFLPLILFFAVLAIISSAKLKQIEATYDSEHVGYETFMNPIQFISKMCEEEFAEIKGYADGNPEKFDDVKYLEELNSRLRGRKAYLLAEKNKEIYFRGKDIPEDLAYRITAPVDEGKSSGYIPGDKILVNQVEFEGSDGGEGRIYLVIDLDALLSHIKHMAVDSGIAMVVIIIVTSSVIIAWLYRSIVKPINKLRLATDNIKNGNLEFEIDTTGKNEFSELFRDFDEMRCRLRDNVNEKLKSDANSREMISNISHDLKTPITAIKGYVEGIRDGVATTDEKREKYIRTIYNKACEMDRLIDELTFYSRIDSDKIIYNFQKLNVMDYFADCVNDIKLELDELNYTLEYDNRVSSDTWVIGDAEQLKRVINNIVGNSIKYMNKKDGVISFAINEDENKVYFEIKDNGPGISSNNLPYIFDRFYRGDMSRNSKKGGSGIGLSIVKKIISDHDGEVSAESVEGEGTTIKIVMKKEKKSYEKSFDN